MFYTGDNYKMGKRLLVLSYWGIDDVLTQGAVLPHVKVLQQISGVSEVVLVTIEREKKTGAAFIEYAGIKVYPLYSKSYNAVLLNKVSDFLRFPKQVEQIIKQEHIDAIVASGALAGALAYKIWLKQKTPFYVLFEPHAAYMRDNKIWHVYDPRYIFQKKWEKQQVKAANGLIVVSANYKSILLKEEPTVNPEHVIVARNPAESALFKFSEVARSALRSQLSIPDKAIVGIYAGKYGGLYYDDEAYQIYKLCFELIPNFRLLILSPHPTGEILHKLQNQDIDLAKVHVLTVQHKDVPAYLSAADFGFATIRSYPSARFCSPVKIGEYWASGLPVLLTEGVGDDSDIIKEEGGGALFNLQQNGSLETAINKIQDIIKNPEHRQTIPLLVAKYRSMEKVKEAYEYFFGKEDKTL